MAGPSVVVERPPDGWTHIGGPSMHLLIDLDEEDERTLAASDAADNGDLDDVIEVLTVGGMRKARRFIGVHTKGGTRVVAFGPVVAVVTAVDGEQREVRSNSAKVWTDLDLDPEPARIVIRVLDENELTAPVPAANADAGGAPAAVTETHSDAATPGAAEPAVSAAAPSVETGESGSGTVPSATPVVQVSPETLVAPAAPAIPTFGGAPDQAVGSEGAGAGRWGRSWARAQQSAEKSADAAPAAEPTAAAEPVVAEAVAVPEPSPEPQVAPETPISPRSPSRSGLPSWDSRRPSLPRRAPASPPPSAETDDEVPPPAPTAREPAPDRVAPADRLGADPSRDVESTWRPSPEAALTAGEPGPASTEPPIPPTAGAQPNGSARPADAVGDDDATSAPSYDYLFGHTGAVAERRQLLAELATPDEEPAGDHAAAPSAGGPSPDPDSNGPTSNPAPHRSDQPFTAAPVTTANGPGHETGSAGGTMSGGLISSVPWATSTPATAGPQSTQPPGTGTGASANAAEAIDVPTFAGRRTPPPAPSLRPDNPPPAPPVSTSASFTVSGAELPRADRRAATADASPPAPVLPKTPSVPTAPSEPPVAPGPFSPSNPSNPLTSPPSGSAEPMVVPARLHRRDQPAAPTGEAGSGERAGSGAPTAARDAGAQAHDEGEPATSGLPTVLAVLCSSGHPTPPHSDCCRVCGAGIPPQTPFTMPRPALGVLRLSTGDVVSLDRSVLLGRAPKLGAGLTGTERPHVVKVPSPERDVSRNHVEVVLEGWHVLIRDLATTNGTTVAHRGELPTRLRANDQQVLEPGSVVSMADEITFTFEAGEGS